MAETRWRDDPNYNRYHKRLHRYCGSARDLPCVKCSGGPCWWARIHTEDGSNPWTDYVPLCNPCHRTYDFDDEWRANIAKGRTGIKYTDEGKAKLRNRPARLRDRQGRYR